MKTISLASDLPSQSIKTALFFIIASSTAVGFSVLFSQITDSVFVVIITASDIFSSSLYLTEKRAYLRGVSGK